uniref:Cyclin-T1 n=1 Tax=Phallusia mammillata TaxID=59560 RepID=A0A6F9D849_9ASCI|nr:cyclin-T1 [Phallusia mammillata]
MRMRRTARLVCVAPSFSSFDWEMASEKDNQWTFSKEQLEKSPSRKHGIDAEKELSYRQQAANLIQDMGQRLAVNQLTINTAIVYMHRFYMYHSFTNFSRYAIAPTALFLAAKVEEQPKKLEHVLKICHTCLHPEKPHIDTHSDSYLKQVQELVQNELILLQTLGFDISVDHPHTHVVKCTQLVKASRDLSQMAYFMATNSLHLTTFCLLYKPAVVAAMCIHLSCKWSNYEIPLSSDRKAYWAYMDPSITEPMLDTIVKEFLKILNRCPTRLRKLKNYRPAPSGSEKDEIKESDTRSNPPRETAQPQNQQESSQISAASKEKKPTMSLEEYKRTHKGQPSKQPPQSSHPTQTKPVQSNPVQSKQQADGRVPHHRDNNKPSAHHLPHPNSQSRPHQVKQEQRNDLNRQQQQRPNPPMSSQSHQSVEGHKQQVFKDPALQRNMMAPGQRDATKMKIPGVKPDAVKPTGTGNEQNDPAEILAVSKDLEGRIRSEKIMQNRQMHAEQSHHHRSATQPTLGGSQNVTKPDGSRRHHSEKAAHHEGGNQVRPTKDFKVYDRKTVIEMYKKHPDKLKSYLKHKAQAMALTDEEKQMYAKMQHYEEERRKRKALEKQQKAKTHVENATAPIASPSGSLTLRIKLPPNPAQPAGEPGLNTSVAKIIASSSGSGSEASPARPRKRGHGNEPAEHSAPKQSRKLEDHQKHHRSSGNGSSSGGSSHKHKRHHQHHSKHHSRSSKNAEHIDEAVFQKSLSAAISKVQKSGIPTVTLKKASNGGEGTYVASSGHHKPEFDPNAPVPSTVPDEIFEDDHDSGAFMGGNSQMGSIVSRDSTPEPGEIKGDTPPSQYWKKSDNHKHGLVASGRAPSLFSPQSDNDLKLQRSSSGFGYHSNNENEFSSPPPPLLRKPVQ